MRDSMNKDLNWLSGGGQMGALIRSMDWSKTSLGPLETWPQSLRTSVSLCLSSTFPILICWGPDDVQIYNDSYRPICGDLHPQSMGMPFKLCWEAALPVVGGKFDLAHLGEGTYINNQRMMLERYGYLEEAWMTFSFGPIRDESGQVGGIFHPITETTSAMLSARRTQTIRDFALRMATAKSVAEVVALASTDHEKYEFDLPFFAFYETADGVAKLLGSSGCEKSPNVIPAHVDLTAESAKTWPLSQATDVPSTEVTLLSERFGEINCGPYPESPHTAVVYPIRPSGYSHPYGYLVAGVSPRRALDDEYRNFYNQLSNAFTTAISNVLAYEEELKRAEALAEIDRAKTAFFSNVSHEFRTPLTLILGPLEDSLADTTDPLSETQRIRQVVTHRNALRLLKLVNSLLDFSRIEAGRLQAHFKPVDLSQLTMDIASNFRSATDRAGLQLRIEASKLPEPIYIDQEMWEKIILNLISNAFKFTFDGEISVSVDWTGEGARVEVRDTGIGVPSKELPRLFERFHRVQGAKGRSFEGTGIGLALVQELVRMHGGTISVASIEGRGTKFSIFIPKGKAHLAKEQIGHESDPSTSAISANAYVEEATRWLPDESMTAKVADRPAEPRRTVLVADDNSDMLNYVSDLLSKDYSVMTAVDGFDALEKARTLKPDLILTDVMMPNLDGFGLLGEIREASETQDIPVILLSARAGEEARLEGLNAGADDYLVKPFSAKELVTRISTILQMDRLRTQQNRALKESEERARVARIEAERANESKTAFLANMSHEIRTPMNSVLGFTELLRDPTISEKDRHDAIQRIERSGRSLLRLIDDILDISKVEAGKVEITRSLFSPIEIATEVISLLRMPADQKGIDLRLKTSPEVPDIAHSDAARVRQILTNLIGNAVKFTDQGSVTVSLRAEEDKFLVFEIIDTGVGIAANDHSRLFQPFAQADASISRRYGGTGLGLALSKKLAERMGGSLVLSWSRPGEGSQFTAKIEAGPFESRTRTEFQAVSSHPVAPEANALTLKGIWVLVAEDSADNQSLMNWYLSSSGARVEFAANGAEAIRKVNEGDFDIVLMDMQMPVMDGLTATQLLRQQGFRKPILALTAHAMQEEVVRSMSAGCDAHLTKPIGKNDLIASIVMHTLRSKAATTDTSES